MSTTEQIDILNSIEGLLRERLASIDSIITNQSDQLALTEAFNASLEELNFAFDESGEEIGSLLKSISEIDVEGAAGLGVLALLQKNFGVIEGLKNFTTFKGIFKNIQKAAALISALNNSKFGKAIRALFHLMKNGIGIVVDFGLSIVDLVKTAMSIVSDLYNKLIDMAHELMSGGSSDYYQALQDMKKEYGALNQRTPSAILDMSKNMTAISKVGLSVFRIFGNRGTFLKEFVAEIATKMGATFEIFATEFAASEGAILGVAKGMGVYGEEMLTLATNAITQGESFTKEIVEVHKSTQKFAGPFQNASKLINRDAVKAMKDVKHFGAASKDAIASAAVYARKLGLDLEKITPVLDTFSNIEGSIEASEKLSEYFNTRVEPYELLFAQDPGRIIEHLRDSFKRAGVDTSRLNRANISLLSSTTGLSPEIARQALSFNNASESLTEINEKVANKPDEVQTLANSLKELKYSIEFKILSGSMPKGGFIDMFLEGIYMALFRNPHFRGLLRDIAASLKITYYEGKRFFGMFVEAFPGIVDFVEGLRRFFNPKDFSILIVQVNDAFIDLIRGARDKSFTLDDFFEKVKGAFFDHLNKFSESDGGRFLDGLRSSALEAVHILGAVVSKTGEYFAEAISYIARFINSGGRIPYSAKKFFSGFANKFTGTFKPIADSIDKVVDKVIGASQKLLNSANVDFKILPGFSYIDIYTDALGFVEKGKDKAIQVAKDAKKTFSDVGRGIGVAVGAISAAMSYMTAKAAILFAIALGQHGAPVVRGAIAAFRAGKAAIGGLRVPASTSLFYRSDVAKFGGFKPGTQVQLLKNIQSAKGLDNILKKSPAGDAFGKSLNKFIENYSKLKIPDNAAIKFADSKGFFNKINPVFTSADQFSRELPDLIKKANAAGNADLARDLTNFQKSLNTFLENRVSILNLSGKEIGSMSNAEHLARKATDAKNTKQFIQDLNRIADTKAKINSGSMRGEASTREHISQSRRAASIGRMESVLPPTIKGRLLTGLGHATGLSVKGSIALLGISALAEEVSYTPLKRFLQKLTWLDIIGKPLGVAILYGSNKEISLADSFKAVYVGADDMYEEMAQFGLEDESQIPQYEALKTAQDLGAWKDSGDRKMLDYITKNVLPQKLSQNPDFKLTARERAGIVGGSMTFEDENLHESFKRKGYVFPEFTLQDFSPFLGEQFTFEQFRDSLIKNREKEQDIFGFTSGISKYELEHGIKDEAQRLYREQELRNNLILQRIYDYVETNSDAIVKAQEEIRGQLKKEKDFFSSLSEREKKIAENLKNFSMIKLIKGFFKNIVLVLDKLANSSESIVNLIKGVDAFLTESFNTSEFRNRIENMVSNLAIIAELITTSNYFRDVMSFDFNRSMVFDDAFVDELSFFKDRRSFSHQIFSDENNFFINPFIAPVFVKDILRSFYGSSTHFNKFFSFVDAYYGPDIKDAIPNIDIFLEKIIYSRDRLVNSKIISLIPQLEAGMCLDEEYVKFKKSFEKTWSEDEEKKPEGFVPPPPPGPRAPFSVDVGRIFRTKINEVFENLNTVLGLIKEKFSDSSSLNFLNSTLKYISDGALEKIIDRLRSYSSTFETLKSFIGSFSKGGPSRFEKEYNDKKIKEERDSGFVIPSVSLPDIKFIQEDDLNDAFKNLHSSFSQFKNYLFPKFLSSFTIFSQIFDANFSKWKEGTLSSIGVENFISKPIDEIKIPKGASWSVFSWRASTFIITLDNIMASWESFSKDVFREISDGFEKAMADNLKSVQKFLEIRRSHYDSLSGDNFPEIQVEFKDLDKEDLIKGKTNKTIEIPGINGTKFIVASTFKLDQSAKELEWWLFLSHKKTIFMKRINKILEEPSEPFPELIIL
jgi:hypothetical protein